MGGVISRVFGSRKEDSKSDVHEPKHRKRWSFRAARRNDEHRVTVPTRSSTMPARARNQAQNEDTRVNAQVENTHVPQRTETEFEEIDEATVANRVQEILRDVADDDDVTPVHVAKPVPTEPEPKQVEMEQARRTTDLVKPVAVAELVSEALNSGESAADDQGIHELQSHSLEATTEASENHSDLGETKDQAPETKDHEPKIEKVEDMWQGQVQAKLSDDSFVLDLAKQSSANQNTTEENAMVPGELTKHEEPVADIEPKTEGIEAVIQEQSHTANTQDPSLLDLVADENVTEQISENHEDMAMDKHMIPDEQQQNEESKDVTDTSSDLHGPESVNQSEAEHGTLNEMVTSPADDKQNTENTEEKHLKVEDIDSNVQESVDSTSVDEPNLMDLVNKAHEEPVPVDENTTENKEIQEEATEEDRGELGQDTHIQAASMEETVEENLKLEAESRSLSEQEHAMDEAQEGKQEGKDVQHPETEDSLSNAEQLEDNASESRSEHQSSEPKVGDFVTDILTEAKHEVETVMPIEPEHQNSNEMNNQEPQPENETEQHDSQIDGGEVAPTNVDNDFIEQLVSSVSNPEGDETSPQSEEILRDNVDKTDENSGKIFEKALDINGEESVISSDQHTESVANGYQE